MDISIPDTIQFVLPGFIADNPEGEGQVYIPPVDVCFKHAVREVLHNPDQNVETKLIDEYTRCELCK